MATINYSIIFLRTDSNFIPVSTDLYYTTDLGQEGFWRYDPSDTTSADNTGLILVTYKSYRLRRIFDSYVNVKWFGAKGDGLTDDTFAIQNAINTIQNYIYKNDLNAHGTLFFPTGIYLVSGLTVTPMPSLQGTYLELKINFIGDGMWYSIIQYFSPWVPKEGDCSFNIAPTAVIFFDVVSPYVTFKDMGFQGTVLLPGITYENTNNPGEFGCVPQVTYLNLGIHLANNGSIIENVLFTGLEIGIDIVGGVATKIIKCLIGGMNDFEFFDPNHTCNYGVCMDYVAIDGMKPNLITITDTIFGWCMKWAVTFANGSMLTMRGCEIEQNGPLDETSLSQFGGIKVYGNLNIEQNVGVINISECWFEQNRGYSFYFDKGEIDQSVIFNFNDCHFYTSGNVYSFSFLGLYINSANSNSNKHNIVNVIGVNSNMMVPAGNPGSFRLIADTINIIGSTILNIDYSSTPNNIGSFI